MTTTTSDATCEVQLYNGITCRRPAVRTIHNPDRDELQAVCQRHGPLDRATDPCPKLGGRSHVVQADAGATKARCRYCSRTIDLTPIVEELVRVPGDQLELELPEPRACASCGGSLDGLRPQATTCSARCRQAIARSRRPAPPAKDLGTCRYCRGPLTSSRQATCSSRCRSALYRSRQGALDTTLRTRLSAVDLFRLQAATAPDAPAPMRVAGASFWACRCGLVVRDSSTSCGFCGGLRPQPTLLEILA